MKFKHINNNQPYQIVFVGEYNNLTQDYIDLFYKYSPLDIYIFDFESLFGLENEWTYLNLLTFVKNEISALKLDFEKTVFVGHGIGATILNELSQTFKPQGIFLVSPIFYLNYINPFTSRIPTYKNDPTSFYLNLSKMYYFVKDFYTSKSDPRFQHRYQIYLDNINYYETMRAQIGLYETLLYIKKHEKNNLENNYMVLGEYDFVVDLKLTLELLKKKKHFVNPWSYTVFEKSAHNAMFEQKKHFFEHLDQKVRAWLKII